MSWAKIVNEKSSLANALDLVGDHWALMIITGCMTGFSRFNQIERHLGINRNLLKTKLDRLVSAGVFEKKPYKENSKHFEYLPTEMCLKLRPIIVGLASWGEQFLTKEDTPITNRHAVCGGKVEVKLYCMRCDDDDLTSMDVELTLNPDAGKMATLIVDTQNVA
ncbi:MAG: helix-turn-helix transcriptional regulator [Robiginitomaculum sp.]|nr:helix-turn-helix transcriptional regulator [Robiginitomaculum sp.]